MDKEIREIITLDDVTYKFRVAPFMSAKNHAFKLLRILKGSITLQGEDFSVDVGEVLANIGMKETQEAEAFVLTYTEVEVNGETVLLKGSANIEKHFGEYRSHYVQVIFEGGKHHFLPFLPDGLL